MIVVLYMIFGAVVLLALTLIVFSCFCFDDEDPDMYWYDNFAPPTKGAEALEGCTHPQKIDIVVNVACTCEEIYTLCDVCNEILNKRTDC